MYVVVGIVDLRAYENSGSWEYGNLGIWEYGNMGIWEYGIMGIWEYGNMGKWDFGNLYTCVSVTRSLGYNLTQSIKK